MNELYSLIPPSIIGKLPTNPSYTQLLIYQYQILIIYSINLETFIVLGQCQKRGQVTFKLIIFRRNQPRKFG